MRVFFLIAAMMVLGFFGGLFYAHLVFVPSPLPVRTATEDGASPRPPPKPAAAAIARAHHERQRRRRLQEAAEAFLSELDELGCALDPIDREYYSDTAKYSMRYELPDGSDRNLEMTGAQYKAFGVTPVDELNLSALDCDQSGRFFKIDKDSVRVLEHRKFDAIYDGQAVEIEQKRKLVMHQNEDGKWVIQELTGAAAIR